MPDKKGRNHDEKKSNCGWEDDEEVRVEADKCINCEQGERMSWGLPGE